MACLHGLLARACRRWRRLGFWRTTLLNQLLLLAWWLGVHPDTLAAWYYR
jgi:hypothetical protein